MTTSRTVPALARILTGLGLVVQLAACKGLTSIDASLQNETATDTVYALNGGPPGSPNAFKFALGVPVRAGLDFQFDVAFDIDQNGDVVVIPARALATNFSNPYSVALQTVPGDFATILEAPKDGYRPDTSTAIPIGKTIVAESRDFVVCLNSLKGQSYYSKLFVTEVDPAQRRIIFIVTVNRNCGFRSFAPGIPEN
jgi:hypothetical protein